MMVVGTISGLWVCPAKGCQGTRVFSSLALFHMKADWNLTESFASTPLRSVESLCSGMRSMIKLPHGFVSRAHECFSSVLLSVSPNLKSLGDFFSPSFLIAGRCQRHIKHTFCTKVLSFKFSLHLSTLAQELQFANKSSTVWCCLMVTMITHQQEGWCCLMVTMITHQQEQVSLPSPLLSLGFV
jgi:hypothetical protein